MVLKSLFPETSSCWGCDNFNPPPPPPPILPDLTSTTKLTLEKIRVRLPQIRINKISQYLKDITNDLTRSNPWEIPLAMAIKFVSSKGYDKKHIMHLMSYNIEIMNNDKINEVTEELFQLLFSRLQIGLET